MKLVIIDPNLDSPNGHHLEWDLAIAAEAKSRSIDVTIFAHNSCSIEAPDHVEIVPWFTHTTYDVLHSDPVNGRFDDFRHLNDQMYLELSAIPPGTIKEADAVLAVTLTENLVLGFVSWAKSLNTTSGPVVIIYLMFPSGVVIQGEQLVEVTDPLQALFYSLAFRRAADPGLAVHFFGCGRQRAREFSHLLGKPIEPHPIPVLPVRRRSGSADRARPAALLYAGDAKIDKGFAIVPQLAERLATSHPGWDFVVHANTGSSWGEALLIYEQLAQMATRIPNLVLRTGRLLRSQYDEMFENADCLVSTYAPESYARKSSGVLWEAISMGIPVLVAEGTWLEEELAEWGGGLSTYSSWRADVIASAFNDLTGRLGELRKRAALAAASFHAENGATALLDQIGRLWVPHTMLANMLARPAPRTLALDSPDWLGWSALETSDGKQVRWCGKQFSIVFEWPFRSGWTLTIQIASYFGPDQIREARAVVDGTLVETSYALGSGTNASILIRGSGQGRKRSKVVVSMALPWAFRPEHELRELGLLVSDLYLSPVDEEVVQPAVMKANIAISTPVIIGEDGKGFAFRDAVSGLLRIGPPRPRTIAILMRTAESPDVVRSTQIFLNGQLLQREISANGRGAWLLKASVAPLAVQSDYPEFELDVLVGLQASSLFWIDDVIVDDVPATLLFKNPLAGGANDQLRATGFPHLQEHREGEPSLVGTELASQTGDAYLIALSDERLVSAQGISTRFEKSGSESYLDIELRTVEHGRGRWPVFQLQMHVDTGMPQLLLRHGVSAETTGFRANPSGRDIQVLSSSAASDFAPDDRAVVEATLALLPAAVKVAVDRLTPDPQQSSAWSRAAQILHKAFRHGASGSPIR